MEICVNEGRGVACEVQGWLREFFKILSRS